MVTEWPLDSKITHFCNDKELYAPAGNTPETGLIENLIFLLNPWWIWTQHIQNGKKYSTIVSKQELQYRELQGLGAHLSPHFLTLHHWPFCRRSIYGRFTITHSCLNSLRPISNSGTMFVHSSLKNYVPSRINNIRSWQCSHTLLIAALAWILLLYDCHPSHSTYISPEQLLKKVDFMSWWSYYILV